MDASSRLKKNPERVEKCLFALAHLSNRHAANKSHTPTTHGCRQSHINHSIPFHMLKSTRCGKEKIKFRTVCGTSESELRLLASSSVCIWRKVVAQTFIFHLLSRRRRSSMAIVTPTGPLVFFSFYFFRALLVRCSTLMAVYIFNFSRWKYF